MSQMNILNSKKSTQDTDIPVIISKENAGFFPEFIHAFFDETVNSSKFPSVLKVLNITPVSKR